MREQAESFSLLPKNEKSRRMAEREGFEPSVPVTQYARLAIWCLRPLGHLSALRNRRIIARLRACGNIRNTVIARQRVFLVSSTANRCREYLNCIGRRLREIVYLCANFAHWA